MRQIEKIESGNFYRASELARFLRVSQTTIYSWIKQGIIRSSKQKGQISLIPGDEIIRKLGVVQKKNYLKASHFDNMVVDFRRKQNRGAR